MITPDAIHFSDSPVKVARQSLPTHVIQVRWIVGEYSPSWVVMLREDGSASITEMPDSLLKPIREIHPHYEKRRSRMANSDYFMNVCPQCNAHFGDFFLFTEPEGAFFPMTDEAAAAITIRKLPIEAPVEIDGSYSMGLGEMIFQQGKMF